MCQVSGYRISYSMAGHRVYSPYMLYMCVCVCGRTERVLKHETDLRNVLARRKHEISLPESGIGLAVENRQGKH
jgi:hypothetical protein